MRGLTTFCFAVVLNVVWAASPAAQHGHDKESRESLLPACQDPSALPSPHCGKTPTATFGPDGRLWIVFSQNNHIYLISSSDRGRTFDPPIAVNRRPEAIYDDGENRPKVALGSGGEVYVSWTHKTAGRYSGDVHFSRSLDGGESFETPLTIHSDRALISHRFDTMVLDREERIFVIWIDKRDKVKAAEAKTDYAGAALYYAVSEDQGKSFKPDRKLVDNSCECCRIAADVDTSGQVVTLWRHVYPVNIRDHAIARIGPASSTISGLPARATDDGWELDGCPHHGPDLSLDEQDFAHLVWFSQGTRNKGLTYGRYSFSKEKLELQSVIDNTPAASRPQVIAHGGHIHVVWKRFDGESTELLMRRSDDGGQSWSDTSAIARTGDGSDYPLIIAGGQQVYVSWQTRAEGYRLIPVVD